MLDVFTQVPLPPGVRDNEATYIANCFQSVESYFIQQRAPLLSAYVLETDPGDPRWDHSWNYLTNCLAKFKFLQDQANSLIFNSGFSAPNISSDRFTTRDYAYVQLYYRRQSQSFPWGYDLYKFEGFQRFCVLPIKKLLVQRHADRKMQISENMAMSSVDADAPPSSPISNTPTSTRVDLSDMALRDLDASTTQNIPAPEQEKLEAQTPPLTYEEYKLILLMIDEYRQGTWRPQTGGVLNSEQPVLKDAITPAHTVAVMGVQESDLFPPSIARLRSLRPPRLPKGI